MTRLVDFFLGIFLKIVYSTLLAVLLFCLASPAQAWEVKISSSFSQEVSELLNKRFLKLKQHAQKPIQLKILIGHDLLRSAEGPESFMIEVERKGDEFIIETQSQGLKGHLYAAYELLQVLGMGFWHPYERPVAVVDMKKNLLKLQSQKKIQKPQFDFRGYHLHTMHPLELTNFLNGMGSFEKPWDDQIFERERKIFHLFLEWLVAHKQNAFHWAPLKGKRWSVFSTSKVRNQRLKKIVNDIHKWELSAGVDLPIAFVQQNAWYLIDDFGDLEKERLQILQGLETALSWGVDFISTEMGLSEFTHPNADEMLSWLNIAAKELERKEVPFFSKVHISSGQYASDYRDPQTGEKLNFNYLPLFAHEHLGVLPHTVQVYSLNDPAPTYGQSDFSDMDRFMQMASEDRETIWYPESSYWVSYDVDVPLALPVYAYKRVEDLHHINHWLENKASAQQRKNFQGQLLFASGWEWSYWFNDVISMRASWNPRTDLALDKAFLSLMSPLDDFTFEGFDQFMLNYVRLQDRLLIHGEWEGHTPTKIEKRNPLAYLIGVETWDEMGLMAGIIPGLDKIQTQPQRESLKSIKRPWKKKYYHGQIRPLLTQTQKELNATFLQFIKLKSQGPQKLEHNLTQEFQDAFEVTALRANHVRATYDLASCRWRCGRHARAYYKKQITKTLDKAQSIVDSRRMSYRAPGIDEWSPNSTVYDFSYLWTVRDLYYWRRDSDLAAKIFTPICFQNIIDPLRTAFKDLRLEFLEYLPGVGRCFEPVQ